MAFTLAPPGPSAPPTPPPLSFPPSVFRCGVGSSGVQVPGVFMCWIPRRKELVKTVVRSDSVSVRVPHQWLSLFRKAPTPLGIVLVFGFRVARGNSLTITPMHQKSLSLLSIHAADRRSGGMQGVWEGRRRGTMTHGAYRPVGRNSTPCCQAEVTAAGVHCLVI
ncbi:hypothetical protein DPEC_G00275220 [Dallia pectoralis]|uniref:Uncharacterized protein n=1 Tax=Dallia pectoralis TaxID=75939 RepID=A0ACC2FLC5_DALPE|nr:hypothetical protein DPEC_G00275220 [Dallia pectoralis]